MYPCPVIVLYLVAFLCGAALMGLELVGARVLAPAMGNSIFVWGSVITSVMVALSLGYWLGGVLADRLGARRTLGPVIGMAAVLTVIAPAVADLVLTPSAELGPRLGSLVASTLIFFAPALLLAMVSPIGVRAASTRAADGLRHVGRSAGGLYAVSTAGSILGTIGTAFWLVPLLQLGPLIVGIGLALAATAVLALAVPGPAASAGGTSGKTADKNASPKAARPAPAVVILALAATAIGSVALAREARPPGVDAQGRTIVFRQDTQYHRIQVTEGDGIRSLRFDRRVQSAMDVRDPYESPVAYTDYLHLALAIKPDARRALVLGLGGGTLSKRMWRDYPEITVDTVELDPVVVEVARRYFAFPDDPRLSVVVQDARRFVQTTDRRYDMIVVDTYYADAVPFHMTTEEFFREAKSRLATDGVVAYNIISAVSGKRSDLLRSVHRTADRVWGHLWVFPIGIGVDGDATRTRNVILLATDADISATELRRRIAARVDGRVTIEGFEGFGDDLYTGIVEAAGVPILTDRFAPTDSLIQLED